MLQNLTELFLTGLITGLLLSPGGVAANQTPSDPVASLPDSVALSEVEIRLDYLGGGGGCLGRCMRYHVTIRGDGLVDYVDLGSEPRDPPGRRTIAVDDVVELLQELFRARFTEALPSFTSPRQAVVREGQVLRFDSREFWIDVGAWTLSLRVGEYRKAMRLDDYGAPAEFLRLRERIDEMGGPEAWR